MTGATIRLAITATRLTDPDTPATSGAVTRWAASATLTASASGRGHPRRISRCDHTGATTIRPAIRASSQRTPRFCSHRIRKTSRPAAPGTSV